MSVRPVPAESERDDPAGDNAEVTCCEQMVALLDAQIEDLENAVSRLHDLRRTWLLRLQASRDGTLSITGNRAPHGSISAHIVDTLRGEGTGLSIAELTERLARILPRFNRRSVQNALGRLKSGGVVSNDGHRWRLTETP